MISVVIPAYNEEKNISKCLEALSRQSTSLNFEVILVDNGSTDKTVELAKKFNQKIDLKIISEKKKGRSPARKKGFDIAQGEIVLSTDADAIVPHNWVEEITSCFDNRKIIAVTGTCFINDCDWLTNTLFNFLQPLGMSGYRLIFGHYWLSGFNFAIRSNEYLQSGGFDENLNAIEDIDLSFKIKKIGKIKFLNNLPVLFSGRRFKKNGLMGGLMSYFVLFWFYARGKRSKTFLSDVREM